MLNETWESNRRKGFWLSPGAEYPYREDLEVHHDDTEESVSET